MNSLKMDPAETLAELKAKILQRIRCQPAAAADELAADLALRSSRKRCWKLSQTYHTKIVHDLVHRQWEHY